MKRILLLLAVLLVLVGMFGGTALADEIVFTGYYGEMFFANGDGTGIVMLWSEPEIYPMTPPASFWDEEGNLVVLFAGNDQTLTGESDCDIFQLSQGLLSNALTPGNGSFQPTLSPDRKKLGFMGYILENGEDTPKIYVLDRTRPNATPKRMNKEKGWQCDPDWGAGGILYTSFSEEGYPEIRLAKPGGKSKTILEANQGGGVYDPSWLSDGSGFAFVDTRDGIDYMHTNCDVTVAYFGSNCSITSEKRLTASGIINYEALDGKTFYFGPACSENFVFFTSEMYIAGIGTRDVYRASLATEEIENISNTMGMHDIFDIAVVK